MTAPPSSSQSDLSFNLVSVLRRPLVGVVLSFIAGTFLGFRVSMPLTAVIAGALLCLVVAWVRSRSSWSVICLHLAVGLVAWLSAASRMPHASGRFIGHLLEASREHVELTGAICGDPVKTSGRYPGAALWHAPVRVEGLKRTRQWQRATGTVLVRWGDGTVHGTLAYGHRVWLKGVLSGPRNSYKNHLLDVDRDGIRRLPGQRGSPFVAWCLERRRACAITLTRGLEAFPDHAGILRALLLGYRGDLPEDLHEIFAATGTLHIFAISGLHVGVLAVLLIAAFKVLGLTRQQWILPLAPLLVVYTIMTGMKPSAGRACVMAIVFWMAFILNRRPDVPSALAFAALLILCAVPSQLLNPGFIFSFVVVVGLMVLARPAWERMPEWMRADPWKLERDSRWKQGLRKAVLWMWGLAAASFAAWLASAPLTAHYFNLFSPVALVGNLGVIPAAFLIVLTGCISLLTGSWVPLLAETFNHANRVFISTLIAWIELLFKVPGGHQFVRSPSWIWVVAWYAALAALLVGGQKTRRTVMGCFGLVVLGVLVTSRLDDRVRVDVLDVGQGNAALVDPPGGSDVLVDAGSRYYTGRVIRHLRKQGIDSLAALVLTHADAQHIGGAREIVEHVPVRELWITPSIERAYRYRDLLEQVKAEAIPVRILEQGATGVMGGGVEWEVMHPGPGEKYRRANDGSLVIRFAREGASVLFMGGGGEAVEQTILKRPIDPSASVLVVGDHGGGGTCGQEWLSAVRSDWAVISVGAYNLGGYPDRDVIDRLTSRGIQTWRTDRQGGCRIELLQHTKKGYLPSYVEISELED